MSFYDLSTGKSVTRAEHHPRTGRGRHREGPRNRAEGTRREPRLHTRRTVRVRRACRRSQAVRRGDEDRPRRFASSSRQVGQAFGGGARRASRHAGRQGPPADVQGHGRRAGPPDPARRREGAGPSGAAVVGQEFTADPVALGKPALSLLDVIPVVHARHPRVRLHAADGSHQQRGGGRGRRAQADVVYTVTRVENALVVIAHLSEGIPRHWLIDNASLEAFLANELEYGLQTGRRGEGARRRQRHQRDPDAGVRHQSC